MLKAGPPTAAQARQAVAQALGDACCQANARRLGAGLARHDPNQLCARYIAGLLPSPVAAAEVAVAA